MLPFIGCNQPAGRGRSWRHSRPSVTHHCCFRHPGEDFQIGPTLDLSKALNNGYRLLLFKIEGYPGRSGFLLKRIQLLAFGFVTVTWLISPKLRKTFFPEALIWIMHETAVAPSSTRGGLNSLNSSNRGQINKKNVLFLSSIFLLFLHVFEEQSSLFGFCNKYFYIFFLFYTFFF